MNKIVIAFWAGVFGTGCYAQAANSKGGPVLDFTNATIIPIVFLTILFLLLYFLAFKPIRRNMTEKNLGFLAAIPPGLYIVLGLTLLAGALFSIMFGNDVSADSRTSRDDRVIAMWLVYSGYFIGILGGVLMMTGFLKGVASKNL